MNIAKQILVVCFVLFPLACFGAPEQIINTTVCEVVANPAAFNHKLIKLAGNVTHGFKQLTLGDTCKTNLSAIWLEYGGLLKAPSVYDQKDMGGSRSRPLLVEGVATTLVDNSLFRKFDRTIAEWSYESRVRVSLIGRYFSGHHDQSSGFESWNGYGHQACCSLLVIQQVVQITTNDPK